MNGEKKVVKKKRKKEGKKRKLVSYTCMANSVKTPHSIWLKEERLEVLGRKEIYLLGQLELFYACITYSNTNSLNLKTKNKDHKNYWKNYVTHNFSIPLWNWVGLGFSRKSIWNSLMHLNV